jgi:hypothetical protein
MVEKCLNQCWAGAKLWSRISQFSHKESTQGDTQDNTWILMYII